MSEGLLSGLLKGTPLANLNIIPQLTQNEIVIEMTQEQLRSLLLEKSDERAKKAVTVECHEGKLMLKIRLF
ncbi:MAG: hypothetical protein QW734_09410 [Candidatus Bathyarchaeia archaeon]